MERETAKVKASLVAEGNEQKVEYETNNSDKEDSFRNEEYSNDGARELFCSSWNDLNDHLKTHMDNVNPIFFPYYNECRQMRLFCYKRFVFWISSYVYNIEHEHVHEKSIFIRNVLYKYGIGFELSSSKYKSTIDQYEISFFDRDELHFVKLIQDDRKNDVFAKLRQDYINYMRKYHDRTWGGDELKIFN